MPQSSATPPFISLAVPCFNEGGTLGIFLDKIRQTLEPANIDYEIVFVDDGSSDDTWEKLKLARQSDQRIKLISLSRNFGKEAALTAAIGHCRGDAVVPIDVDLQDPPELIPEMVALWRQGFEVVTAKRKNRDNDSVAKRATAHAFYRLFNLASRTQLPLDTGDFRLMDRKVVDAFCQIEERNRFLKGVFAWLGFRHAFIPFDRDPRASGRSKFNASRLLRLAIDGLFAFSSMPLRVWCVLGGAISILSFAYASFLVIRTLIYGIDVPGYASIMVVMLFLGGIQLVGLGVLGEYLGRVYDEVKRRPLYLVRETHGIEKGPNSPPSASR